MNDCNGYDLNEVPPPLMVRECPACGGEGVFYERPSRQFRDDPDFEVAVTCSECGGAGLVEGDPDPIDLDEECLT